MSIQALLLPLFVQVALTFALMLWMGRLRIAAVRAGKVKLKDIALRQPNWPERPTQIANAFHNQLELPVLYYVLVALALIARKADLLFVALSWLFVALRLAHTYIFVTSNRVWWRFQVYVAGAVVLLLMWIIFAVHILLGV